MAEKSGFWRSLGRTLFAPKVSEELIEETLHKVRGELPTPVFWLFGKAQSGKTSIIRALTGSTRAEIGNGFRPCTRTARLYSFPDEEQCFIKFLDTRGLGEVHYDPAEDLQTLKDQAHLMIVVVKALDHAQQSVLEPLKAIRKRDPDLPLIVAQTCLHEGYPEAQEGHVLPYPYTESPLPETVPVDLKRSLAAQRKWFPKDEAHFVPLDFTLPEDGFEVEDYGLDALWTSIEEVLPLGLRGILQETREVRRTLRNIYFRKAHPHILSYALMAGGAGSIPVPVVDLPLILAIQAKMFHTVAGIYGQKMDAQRMAEIGSVLGIGYLARMGGRELLKLVPGFGMAVSALYCSASTYALGRTLCVYFSYALDGDLPDAKMLRRLYAEEYEEGRKRLGTYVQKMLAGGEEKDAAGGQQED